MKKNFLLFTMLILAGGCSDETGWRLAPGIYILDKDTPVETYADLADKLPRKAIYVDRWATWCEPCLEEFAYYDGLRTFLEENNIEILYLNSDMDIGESQWFTFIKGHELQGYHVRLNKSLQRDLIDNGLFIPMIPQFMIIDSTGKVLEKSAKRPSNGEALCKQFIETLGLQVKP
jgi:thiol-disulfide isomerase/thioredoxin